MLVLVLVLMLMLMLMLMLALVLMLAHCRMVFEKRIQSMAWMEHRSQISLKRYTLSMEDKMTAGAGRATNV